MATEIVDDIRVATIEISNESGINLSNYNSRLKHTGGGSLILTSTSSQDNAISIDLPNGGLDVNVAKTVDFKASDDTTEAITLQALEGGISIIAENQISVLSNSSINIESGLTECNAINISALTGGMNAFAQNIFISSGETPFYPLNRQRTGFSDQLNNLINHSYPLVKNINTSQTAIELTERALNPRVETDLPCPAGFYSQAAQFLMTLIVDRSSSEADNNAPGLFIVSNQSATIIQAIGASGTPDDESYINSDLILFSEGTVMINSDGPSGIMIGTEYTVPIVMGTTENLTTIKGDLTVSGNLKVDGYSVQNNVTVFTSEDPVFYLNTDCTGVNEKNIGFIGERGTSENVGWIWRETAGEWVAIGTDSNGVDNINTDVNDYKPARFGGLNVVTDTSRGPTATVFNVNVNGSVSLETSLTTTNAVSITSAGGIDVNTVSGIDITNTENTLALSVNQQGTADIAHFKDNGSSALIVKDGGTVGINTSTPSASYKLDVNGNSNTANRVYQEGFMLVPPGAMMPYAAASAPGGWLLCDGSAVSRTTYATLYGLIGTTYGIGDGEFTFNLPNLKGRMIVGLNGADASFDALGETGGSKTATLTTTELPAHTHTGTTDTAGAHSHTYNDAYFAENRSGGANNKFGTSVSTDNDNSFIWRAPSQTNGWSDSPENINTSSVLDHSHTFTTNSTGSGSSFSIMNPYFVLNYIIKY
jgi:microcystin-dependent protein